jgi:exopolysaccharide production protein ExoQ
MDITHKRYRGQPRRLPMTTTLHQPTDSTTAKDRSSFLLLPGLIGFVFSFRVCLTVLWFQEEPQQASILSVALSLTLLIAAALSTIGSTPSVPTVCFRTPTIRWIAAFLGIALLSLLWTPAPMSAAAGYWIAWAADIATIWFILREGPPEDSVAAIMKGFACGACLVAVVAWCLPATVDLRLGDEDFLHPNALGFLFSIATLFAFHLSRKTTVWTWPALFLGATLLRTLSKSSIIAFVAAFGFALIRDSTLSRKAKIWIGIAAGIIVASLWGLLEAYLINYSEGLGPETLTGRTVIWAASLEYAVKKPLLGNGFYSYRFIVPSFGIFVAQQAHDELLQQFFSFGAVGALLTIGIYWIFFRQIRRSPPSHLKTLSATLLLFALIRGLTDTQIFDLSFPLWLMAMLSILLAARTSSLSLPPTTAENRGS